jgi:phage-related protein
VMRPLVWLGDSRRNIQAFPSGARKLIGDELQLVQFGGTPKDAKPFKGIGSGVFEIALAYETNAFRAVYAVQLGKKIYVLHAFQKKSKSGIKTPQKDIDLIKRRYKEAKELAKREEK